ncbi:MAG: hypothetical protein WC969_12640 [Elusimicrobiota bacterium]|jgi:hypothetical protein
MLYMRFVLCLGFGLFGISLLLKTLIDALFLEWDVVGDAVRYFDGVSRRRRYVTLELQPIEELTSRMQHPGRVGRRELPEPVAMPDAGVVLA